MSIAELAEEVGLTNTSCWRRVQNLEKESVIQRRVTLLNQAQPSLGVDVFVAIRTSQNTTDRLQKLAQITAAFPEV